MFATCLADVMRPQIADAATYLIEDAGGRVRCPRRQTCCGQIAFNSGYFKDAADLARSCADLFNDCEAVVFPSGSCCGFFRAHWREMFPNGDPEMRQFSAKCMELSEFLRRMDYVPSPRKSPMRATFHDCCAGLRELGIKEEPRALLRRAGVEIAEMEECEECCGFGGAFAAKFGAVSAAMADRKCASIVATGADVVLLGDLGCLLHMEGRMRRDGQSVRFMHWAEALAGAD